METNSNLHAVSVKVNGVRYTFNVPSRELLVYFLRRRIKLKGPRVGCETSNCGACTIIMNGKPLKSCTAFAVQANGAEILTVEGLTKDGSLHPLQEAFSEAHALQCGYCTPGFLMCAYSLLQENPRPTDEEIRHELAGNLCMCTGYLNIIKAVKRVAEVIGGKRPQLSEGI